MVVESSQSDGEEWRYGWITVFGLNLDGGDCRIRKRMVLLDRAGGELSKTPLIVFLRPLEGKI